MAKTPLTTRVKESVANEVEQEAENQGLKKSEYLREIIERRHENYQQVESQQQTIEHLREQLAEEEKKNQRWADLFDEHLGYMEDLKLIESDTLRSDIHQLEKLRNDTIKGLEAEIDRLDEQRGWMERTVHDQIHDDIEAVREHLENFDEESNVKYLEEKQEELAGHYNTLNRWMRRKPEPDHRIDINRDTVGLGKILGAMVFGWILFGTVIPTIISGIISAVPSI